jgi:hypothetical protein
MHSTAAPILAFPLSLPAPSQGEGTQIGLSAEIDRSRVCRTS